ncbi:MAG: hypothetical protein ACLGGX_04750 [Bdellovibrionia bacterium]
MRLLTMLLIFTSMSIAQAENKIKMYFTNEELVKIIQIYSKASGQKFIVDPGVRGKVSIFVQEPVSIEEGFNHLSSALALNGYAISKQGDTMVVKASRNIQRDLIEVSTERPAIKPERMYTWVYNVKHMTPGAISSDLRNLMSRDGEIAVSSSTNHFIFTDWVTNLNRIADLLKEIDKPLDASTVKLIEASKKEKSDRKKSQMDLKLKTED